MPAAAQMLNGNLGDVDKLMLLSRLQSMAGGGAPGMGPGGPPMDPMAMMAPPIPGGPAGPLPGGPLPGGPLPIPGAGPIPWPMAGPVPIPGPPPMSPQPPLGNPGGALPLQLLLQMLSGTQGMV